MDKLSLWTNGADTYIARDANHAHELMAAHLGETPSDYTSTILDWYEETKQTLTIGDDDKGTRTKTRGEWIAENGPGFLCSTEW